MIISLYWMITAGDYPRDESNACPQPPCSAWIRNLNGTFSGRWGGDGNYRSISDQSAVCMSTCWWSTRTRADREFDSSLAANSDVLWRCGGWIYICMATHPDNLMQLSNVENRTTPYDKCVQIMRKQYLGTEKCSVTPGYQSPTCLM
jgi:hypothetical protein